MIKNLYKRKLSCCIFTPGVPKLPPLPVLIKYIYAKINSNVFICKFYFFYFRLINSLERQFNFLILYQLISVFIIFTLEN